MLALCNGILASVGGETGAGSSDKGAGRVHGIGFAMKPRHSDQAAVCPREN